MRYINDSNIIYILQVLFVNSVFSQKTQAFYKKLIFKDLVFNKSFYKEANFTHKKTGNIYKYISFFMFKSLHK